MKPTIEAKRLALQLWREREARFPARLRRWTPDEIDHASGAWGRMVAEAERRIAATRGQEALPL
jgi:hypothetical protein